VEYTDLVIIGEVVASHGNRGEVRINPLTDFPERFNRLTRIILVDKAGRPVVSLSKECLPSQCGSHFDLEYVKFKKHQVILKLKGIDTVLSAQRLVSHFVAIPREERLELPEGSFYIDDVIGLCVETEEGDFLGRVKHVFQTGANDVYELDNGSMIPAIADVVLKVDLSLGKITIRPMRGLL
jgi:16S rRNA processing protein RimM